MNINRMTTMEEVLTLIPWEYEIQQKGRVKFPIQKLLLIIRDNIEKDNFIILFAHEEGEPRGFCIGFVPKLPGNKTVHILRMYGEGLVDTFIEELTAWGKQFGMNKIGFTIEKNRKAVERKYGFKQVSINMERGIE